VAHKFLDEVRQVVESYYWYPVEVVETEWEEVNAVGWHNLETQTKRFDVLAQIGDLNGASVLDVGSGLGALYSYMNNTGMSDVDYLGIDVLPKMTAYAQNKYHQAEFQTANILNFTSKQFDFVLLSGTLNNKVSDNLNYLLLVIKKMMILSEKGIAFNLLVGSPEKIEKSKNDPSMEVYYYDPKDVAEIIEKIGWKTRIIDGYLENDITVFMYPS
jgi:SAM-dependent methyltransferase